MEEEGKRSLSSSLLSTTTSVPERERKRARLSTPRLFHARKDFLLHYSYTATAAAAVAAAVAVVGRRTHNTPESGGGGEEGESTTTM